MPSLRLLEEKGARRNSCRARRDLKSNGLFDFAPTLFPVPFPGQSRFDSFLLTWLQIERMPLDLFNDVFLLHFSFEAPEGIFQCFALLKSDFRQLKHTPHPILVLPAPADVRRRASIDIIWA